MLLNHSHLTLAGIDFVIYFLYICIADILIKRIMIIVVTVILVYLYVVGTDWRGGGGYKRR